MHSMGLNTDKSVLGQVNQADFDINAAKYHDAATVPTNPPRKPSQVFFGESFIRGVLPKSSPAK